MKRTNTIIGAKWLTFSAVKGYRFTIICGPNDDGQMTLQAHPNTLGRLEKYPLQRLQNAVNIGTAKAYR